MTRPAHRRFGVWSGPALSLGAAAIILWSVGASVASAVSSPSVTAPFSVASSSRPSSSSLRRRRLPRRPLVPRGKLQELFNFTNGLEKAFGFPVACFGHAGDGNIHVNIMVDLSKPGAKKKCDAALDALFRKVVELGGVVTGEHGIGLAKKPWWPLATSRAVRDLHQAVKGALDPEGILNPGKFLG